jgi:glutamate--cysteine ligase
LAQNERTFVPDPAEPARRDDLVRFFESASRPDPRTHLIGTELEKFGVVATPAGEPLLPVQYQEHVLPVLQGLVQDHGWTVGKDRGIDGQVIELRRGEASITLEPGGQLELSGAPLSDVHQTCAEFTQHYRELHAVSEPLGIAWFTIGMHPFATREQINWMPKGRYAVMRAYLPTRGAQAVDMMLRTCTVQANFDFSSEENCGRRLRTAAGVAPIVTATFANSPLREGRITGLQSTRSMVWTEVDPDRCGLRPFFFESPFRFERYVDWALQVPMFFVKRDGRYHHHHATFADFLAHGYVDPDGKRHEALWGDWVLHLSTLFPEVRLKPYIEFRSADAVPSRFVCALPALLKGLLYDDDACAAAWELVSDLDFDARVALWHEGARHGLRSDRIREHAKRLAVIARGALDRIDIRDSKGRTEARFLDPVDDLLARGRSPADDVIDALGSVDGGADAEAQRSIVRAGYFAGKEV